ncbi:mitochondrial carrier domain-containing protein [Lipomyces orientalis]|uniref:Mitochondrial carrier domain-containing protein n=1 Tax=Lipomyces orientalis TaxID=1233043 RepID=A0ACC3TIT3_9ASCO
MSRNMSQSMGLAPTMLPSQPSPSPSSTPNRSKPVNTNQYVGAATAGTRALLSQLMAFYVRVPIKLFRPTRVDYLLVPRAINPAVAASLPWKFHTHSSIALLRHAVKEHGWSFIPNQVLPPLLANSAVGIFLYTTYLTALPLFSEHKVQINNVLSSTTPDVLTPRQTFLAGFIAGGAQSLAAAPVDAIFTRFSVNELLMQAESGEMRHKSLWHYSIEKLRAIGLRGVFAGYTISLTKEALGFACFFSTFESVKQWSYARIVRDYGAPIPKYVDAAAKLPAGPKQNQHSTIREKPSAALYPATILGAGAAATIALQTVQYPLSRLQNLHLTILESIDFNTLYRHEQIQEQAKSKGVAFPAKYTQSSRRELLRTYMHTYQEMFRQARALKNMGKHKAWVRWLYKGFARNTLSAVPSSSVGLFVFEIMRVRYMEEVEGADVELDFEP